MDLPVSHGLADPAPILDLRRRCMGAAVEAVLAAVQASIDSASGPRPV
jgi:hypothetical protein